MNIQYGYLLINWDLQYSLFYFNLIITIWLLLYLIIIVITTMNIIIMSCVILQKPVNCPHDLSWTQNTALSRLELLKVVYCLLVWRPYLRLIAWQADCSASFVQLENGSMITCCTLPWRHLILCSDVVADLLFNTNAKMTHGE